MTFKKLEYINNHFILIIDISIRIIMISTYDLSMDSAHYVLMGEPECKKIHIATLKILERTGVDVYDETARNILIKGGATVNRIRL